MRKIIHVDMDCFYAAVEEKMRPDLKNRPLGIGGPPNTRSVLCTANYEARKYGVRAAMPSSLAVRLCPQLILVPPHFDLYKAESKKVRSILERFSELIEPLSLDEAYLDVSNCTQFQGSATRIAAEIRRLIKTETGLTASAGVAPNKFLAKVASDWRKPDGLFVIKPEDIDSFMPTLPVEKIFGIGKVTAKKLHSLGIATCKDLQLLTEHELYRLFGSRASYYANACRGIDERPLITHWERKSLSVEETFHEDIHDFKKLLHEVPPVYEELLRRMERGNHKEKIRGAFVKIKTAAFQQSTLEEMTTHVPSLREFELLFQKIWERSGGPCRLIGLGVRLSHSKDSEKETGSKDQLSFFSQTA